MTALTTADAAARLGVSARQVRNLIAQGDLNGRQLSDGTWLLDSASVNAHQRRRNPPGRNWTAEASWALLAELSNLALPGVSDSTRARIRRRIRESTAETIIRRVASRITWHTFTTSSDRAVANRLTLTGRSAADVISPDLAPHGGITEGYVPDRDALESLRRDHLLVEDPAGSVRIAISPASWPFHRIAPEVVVAADLGQSPSPRDRSAAMAKIEEIRATWLRDAGT